ncbi:MAG: ABC transporter ATP-binding protein [Acidimicrobiales bacterium]
MGRYCVGPAMAVDWGDDAPPPVVRQALLRRALASFHPYRRKGALVVGCIVAGAALGLVPALVTKALIDHLTGAHRSFGHLAALVIGGVLASLLGGLVGVGESYLRTVISQGIICDLRSQLFERLLGQSVSFFTDRRTGDVFSRVNNDVSGIEDVVGETVFGLAESSIVGVSTLAFMAVLDWRLTVFVLLVMPVFMLPARRVGTRIFRARKAIQEKLAEIGVHAQEVLGISGVLLVKAFGNGGRERARLRALSEELRDLEVRHHLIGRWFSMLMGVLATAGPGLFWLFGGYLVIHGGASVGTVVTFVAVLTPRLAGAVGNLGNLQVNVTGSLALFQRIFTELDRVPAVVESHGATALTGPSGAIRFEDVTFSYRPQLAPALDRVSFEVEPGRLVALVGPSGAGKTTVTSLLCRFYDPQDGAVRIDGYDLRDLTLDSLGGAIGVVFQNSFLFHARVRENLLYARPDATAEDMEAAARAAFIHDFVAGLPDGYDTVVGERGHRLSGGEKQRLAIARVILKDPRILVLDEATSHLDSVSEHLIQSALGPLFAGRTSIVIAHRLSTVLAADTILVLDRGRIAERGRHSDLVGAGGLYAQLYERQFARGIEPTPVSLRG